MPFWATAFLCMAALAGQQWARPVRHDACAPQCGGVCHEAASADGDAAHEQAAAALLEVCCARVYTLCIVIVGTVNTLDSDSICLIRVVYPE